MNSGWISGIRRPTNPDMNMGIDIGMDLDIRSPTDPGMDIGIDFGTGLPIDSDMDIDTDMGIDLGTGSPAVLDMDIGSQAWTCKMTQELVLDIAIILKLLFVLVHFVLVL